MSVNKVILIGNLGGDVELKETRSGESVANFSLATNEKWTDKKGQKQEKTEWHKITVWGRTAENCAKYVSKGSQIYLEGSISTDKWQDDDGNDRYTTKITAHKVQFLQGGEGGGSGDRNSGSSRNERPRKRAPKNRPHESKFDQSFSDDDIPF